VDRSGNLLIADALHWRVRVVAARDGTFVQMNNTNVVLAVMFTQTAVIGHEPGIARCPAPGMRTA